MTDWKEAQSALEELYTQAENKSEFDDGPFMNYQKLQAALKSGEKAERGLERAVEVLAGDEDEYGECPAKVRCQHKKDHRYIDLEACQDCWRSYLSQPIAGEDT